MRLLLRIVIVPAAAADRAAGGHGGAAVPRLLELGLVQRDVARHAHHALQRACMVNGE